MNPNRLVSILLLFCFFSSMAQLRDVEVSHEYRSEKEDYVIFVKNNTSDYRTVIIKFTTFSNLRSSTSLPAIVEVGPYERRKGFTLSKTGIGTPNFRYTYTHYLGCARPKPDLDVLYTLPVAKGKKTRPIALTNLGNYIKNDERPDDWNAVGFTMNAGDTVYCVRRGVVEDVVDEFEMAAGKSFDRNVNKVKIRHNDCTYGRYANFQLNDIFVKPGDAVEVGDPIGIVNGVPYAGNIHIRLLFYYNPIMEQLKEGKEKIESVYFPVKFASQFEEISEWDYTKQYTSSHSEELITQEMSKRQIKKWLKSKGN